MTESVEVRGLNTPLLSLEVCMHCHDERRHRRTPGPSPGPGTLVRGGESVKLMKCVTDSTRSPMLMSGLAHIDTCSRLAVEDTECVTDSTRSPTLMSGLANVDTFSRLAVDAPAYPGEAPGCVSALLSLCRLTEARGTPPLPRAGASSDSEIGFDISSRQTEVTDPVTLGKMCRYVSRVVCGVWSIRQILRVVDAPCVWPCWQVCRSHSSALIERQASPRVVVSFYWTRPPLLVR